MCRNALIKINKTNPNLSFCQSGAPGKAGWSLGIFTIKIVTQTLRPGCYKPHPTFDSSLSRNYIFLLSLVSRALITTHT